MKLILLISLLFTVGSFSAEKTTPPKEGAKKSSNAAMESEEDDVHPDDEQEDDKMVNLENEDAFIDLSDALKSKHFVRRAILNAAIKDSSRFHLDKPYVNHQVGFNAILQRVPRAKHMYAMQSIAGGYVFDFGLGVEGGFEFSGVSSFFIGIRYVFDEASQMVWPYIGLGVNRILEGLSVSDTKNDLGTYTGSTTGTFLNLGLMIPLVDIGLKAEVRANVFGSERIVVTTGLGAILFL